ncbi:MAG: hypothetical protein PGN07_10170 [Aeromicrobium erythreum]
MSRTAPGRRRLDTEVPQDYEIPTRTPRLTDARTAGLAITGVFTLWVVATLLASTAVVKVPGVPSWVERPAAAALLVVFSIGLTHRAGGHMRIWTSLALLLGVSAAASQASVLLSAATVTTAVLGSVWAVLITRPAATVGGVVREYLVALLVGLSSTMAVAAWNAPVNFQRFNLLVLFGALVVAIALVWSLGAGLHGLGRQNLGILLGVAAVLLVLLAYSSFVRSYGSQALVEGVDNLVIWMRTNIGGVPRPVEVFLGFPALVVGVSVRSRRREGWWILVFAVIGTGVLSTSLVSPGAFPTYIGWSTLYSVVLGLVVGLLVRYPLVKQPSARRSRAIVPERRSEPGRFAPLR